MSLVPLPKQDPSVAWPTVNWEHGPIKTGDAEQVEAIIARAFDSQPRDDLGLTLAVVCIQGGRLVAERYAESADHETPLISWSMAKSMTQALLGLLAHDGLLTAGDLVMAPEWDGDGERERLDIKTMLAMRSGLLWNEDYVDHEESHCLQMLFGTGAEDMAAYAAGLPLAAEIDSTFNYSSGTTNILSRLAGDKIAGTGATTNDYLTNRLFGPLGMTSADPRFDPAGTFIGSSYVYATARDFARFGHFYLRDGVWGDERLLPEGWVDRARTTRSVDESTGNGYGEHWWTRVDDPLGTFWANGYEGQSITIVPPLDLVVVRLGKSLADLHRDALTRWRWDLIDAFAED